MNTLVGGYNSPPYNVYADVKFTASSDNNKISDVKNAIEQNAVGASGGIHVEASKIGRIHISFAPNARWYYLPDSDIFTQVKTQILSHVQSLPISSQTASQLNNLLDNGVITVNAIAEYNSLIEPGPPAL